MCPKCNSQMIKRYENRVLTTYPPQYPWYWWCGCGHEEGGGIERCTTEEEAAMMSWKAVNDSSTSSSATRPMKTEIKFDPELTAITLRYWVGSHRPERNLIDNEPCDR